MSGANKSLCYRNTFGIGLVTLQGSDRGHIRRTAVTVMNQLLGWVASFHTNKNLQTLHFRIVWLLDDGSQ